MDQFPTHTIIDPFNVVGQQFFNNHVGITRLREHVNSTFSILL